MRVLVTGSTSLIGRAAVALLADRGDEVTVFQRQAGGAAVIPTQQPVREITGDVSSVADVGAAVEGQEAVIHLAAKVGATGTWADYEETNVVGTQNLVEASAAAGVQRFVQVSSPSVAHSGMALVGAGAAPADPLTTRGFYSTSKALAEVLALKASSEAMAVVAIRPHLVWGPGDTQLVGRIVSKARSGRLGLVGSGAALVDSTYVDNAATALIAALDRAPYLGGQAFVVSNGQPRTVSELFDRILRAAGVAPVTRHVPTKIALVGGQMAEHYWRQAGRDDDPPMTGFLAEQLSTAHWFDQRETQAALAWAPSVGLDEGFRRLAQWFDDRGKATGQSG